MSWQPTSSLETLRARAKIIARIREFFSARNILEVETPLLSHATVTDPHVHGIPCHNDRYLQTSPEYAMKRLLAAGVGSIFQICKAFRQNDFSQRHKPEFTMLEWYRIDFDHHALMNEMDELLQFILNSFPADRFSCAEVYKKYIDIDLHTASDEALAARAKELINFRGEFSDRNAWLDLLFTHCIEPHIGIERPVFLYDFPVCQAALAKIRVDENPPVASRFEVYFKGLELANGFHELQDAQEQRRRFENDLAYRRAHHLPLVPIDENFLAALSFMPECAGVALGVDRLVMLALDASNISAVMSFTIFDERYD